MVPECSLSLISHTDSHEPDQKFRKLRRSPYITTCNTPPQAYTALAACVLMNKE